MDDLGQPVEIIRVRKHEHIGSKFCIVDYRIEATGNFEYSLIVEAEDELTAWAKFPETLAYWQRKSEQDQKEFEDE